MILGSSNQIVHTSILMGFQGLGSKKTIICINSQLFQAKEQENQVKLKIKINISFIPDWYCIVLAKFAITPDAADFSV